MAITATRFAAAAGALGLILGLGSPRADSQATIEPRTPTPSDRCPVCGMTVAPHPAWLAQIVFDDGSVAFFDGAKDLFRHRLRRAAETSPQGPAPAAIFVTSYYSLAAIPAQEAWFVVGSDVTGPMGAELVPHANQAEAEEFLRDHGGLRVLRFQDVTADELRALR